MSIARVRLLVAVVLVVLPVSGFAQEATLSGTVTDSAGGVLPGVAVRAVHDASGNTTEVVTDGRGGYRIPVRIGVHRITAELAGFSTVTRIGVELAVGQQAVVNFEMSPALTESITVDAQAPLVDVTRSRPSGVIDPKQMEELPVNGRNFLDLVTLAPGSRANSTTNMGVETQNNRGNYQLNIDGQQVTSAVLQFRLNPTFSRDALAEFEFLANRFDATQGRSLGAVLNVVTKSGTNTAAGTLSGYFRNDRFNAADFIQHTVVPYSDQQVSTTYGGPIVRDRFHIFGSYEYEREPQTITYSSPFPSFNLNQATKRVEEKALVRGDYQFSSATHLSVRWARSDQLPYLQGGGATRHPSSVGSYERHNNGIVGTLTQVLSNRTLNEIKVGWSTGNDFLQNLVNDPVVQSQYPASLSGARTLGIQLQGYRIGSNGSNPAIFGSDTYTIRDQLTYTFTKGPGSHGVKIGGEFLFNKILAGSCVDCFGLLDTTGCPIPKNIEALFPVWDDPATWNVGALSSCIKSFQWMVGDITQRFNRPDYAVWFQDDWKVTRRLTLNPGVRWDLSINQFANAVSVPPFLPGNRPDEWLNIGPRFGWAFSLNDRTVLRGGLGKYFATTSSNVGTQNIQAATVVEVNILNDGRPDFWKNPFNGPVPTRDQIIALGQQRSILDALGVADHKEPYSVQTSVGVERQFGTTMALSADFTAVEGRGGGGFGLFTRNINLSYNPVTGANYPYTDTSHVPYPTWGPVAQEVYGIEDSLRSLDVAWQKRLSNRWQASATYTLSGLWDWVPPPNVGFPLATDFGGERTFSILDQRHRAVFNGIWQAGYGFELSGLYFYGSGQRFATTYSGDLRLMGTSSTNRLRPDGTIVPRNNFVGLPLHRVDIRLQRRFGLGRAKLDGIFEVFNLLNHANYGSYVTNEASKSYGLPSANVNGAYKPRTAQLGFRLMF